MFNFLMGLGVAYIIYRFAKTNPNGEPKENANDRFNKIHGNRKGSGIKKGLKAFSLLIFAAFLFTGFQGSKSSAPSYNPNTGNVSSPDSGLPSCTQWHQDCITRNRARTDLIADDPEAYIQNLCDSAAKHASNNSECE